MTTTELKKQKSKSKVKPIKSFDEALEKKAWEKVKIKGRLISDDGGGYEGLIGLEVLENYDPKLIGTAKARTRKQKRMERKQLKVKKRKLDTNDSEEKSSSEDSDADDDSEDDDHKQTSQTKGKNNSVCSIQGTRKERLAARALQKIQKRKERREKRKQKKQQQQGLPDQNKTKNQVVNTNKSAVESKDQVLSKASSCDRFALLRPPPPSDDEEDTKSDVEDKTSTANGSNQSEKLNRNTLEIDDLEGWNGLGVPQPILRALAENGFKSPTEIQAMTLPAAILGKKDILGAAETGSGKTLAFGIPILAGILELKAKNSRTGIRKAPKRTGQEEAEQTAGNSSECEEERECTPPPEEMEFFPELPTDNEETQNTSNDEDEVDDISQDGPLYAVVLTPTRELAVQVKDHLVAVAKYTGIKIAAIFGGLAVAKQERLLRQCPEIVVATPGRFWELYDQENPHLSKIDDISFLVIDETDRMVEKGHFEELRLLLKVINADEVKKQSRQNFVFSATLTLVHDLPEYLQKRNAGKRPSFLKQTPGMKIQGLIEELGISQPKIVDITNSQQTAQTLTECRLICPIDHKDYYLYYFVQRHPGRTIVFSNSIDCVKRLATLFGLLDCNPLPLHASMIQKQRLKNLERFRDNPNGLLIATDVAARGLDIPNVEHVIHYQVPRTSENYVHRSGRTARANRNGITVMFMEPGEVKTYVKLYKTLDRTEDLPLFPVSERYLAEVKERVNLAREVDKQELKLRRNQSEAGWMKKHAEEMDIIVDGYNDASGSDQDEDAFIIERRRDRVNLESTRLQLRRLLAKPIFPRGFSFKYPTSTGQLVVPDMGSSNNDSAVKVMEKAIEDMKLAKKMRNKKKK